MADRNEIDLEATRAPVILGGIVAASVVCTLFTAARLWVRGKILGRLHADDWLVVASVISIWVSVAIAFVAVEHGNGRHLEALNQEQQETVVFWTLVGFPFGILSFGLPKLAVVALLTRIMNPSRMHKAILWTMTIGCNVLLVLNALFLLGRCQPAESQWNFDIEGTCWDPRVLVIYAIVTGAYSAFIDFYLAVYPALTLSRLQMKRKKKIGLMIALGIGSASTAVAIYKCTRLPLLAAKDFSWETADLVILNVMEGSTIIIAACIPVLQPLVQIIFYGKTFDSFGTYARSRSTPKNPTSQGGVGPSTGLSDTYPLSPRSPAPLLNHTSREDLRNHSEDDMDLHSFLGLPPGASKEPPRSPKQDTSSFENIPLPGTAR